MLGDAERPADLGGLGCCVVVSELLDDGGRYAGESLSLGQGVWLDGIGVRLEAGCRVIDKALVDKPGVDDLATDGVGEGDV